MKRLIPLVLGFCAGVALAQAPAPEVPKPHCDPKPELPGEMMRDQPGIMKHFNEDMDRYRKCMVGYIDERRAAMKANEEAANAAAKEYNDTVKAINAAAQ